MRAWWLFILVFSGLAWAEQQERPMWRLDFTHSGGAKAESFEVQAFVLEPKPWSGPDEDKLLRGDYKVELFTKGSTKPWFSQSYSSVFSDWARGVDAKTKVEKFEESVRFPAPKEPSALVISRRDLKTPGQPFIEVWRTDVKPTQSLERPSPVQKTVSKELKIAGEPSAKLDLLFLAEGFTLDEKESFFDAAEHAMAELLSVEPYLSLQHLINVRALFVASNDSGLGGDTAFHVNPNALGMSRYALTLQDRTLRTHAMMLPYDHLVILTNSDQYSASGIYRAYTVVPAFEKRLRFLLVHELGHHIAGLADEYFHDTPGYAVADVVIEPHEPNITALADPTELKWRQHIHTKTPIPTPWPREQYMQNPKSLDWAALAYANEVGAFQGANYSPVEYYRPSLNCLMFRNGQDNQFCPVCNQAIKEAIEATSQGLH